MLQLKPYVSFNGQCEEAFTFYTECLGGKFVMLMRFSESPMAERMPPDWQSKVIHATIAVGDDVLSGADAPPGYYEKPQGFSVTLNTNDPAEAERMFNALVEGGTVRMPLQETFWAQRFGMLVDRFGTPWMINCGNPA